MDGWQSIAFGQVPTLLVHLTLILTSKYDILSTVEVPLLLCSQLSSWELEKYIVPEGTFWNRAFMVTWESVFFLQITLNDFEVDCPWTTFWETTNCLNYVCNTNWEKNFMASYLCFTMYKIWRLLFFSMIFLKPSHLSFLIVLIFLSF